MLGIEETAGAKVEVDESLECLGTARRQVAEALSAGWRNSQIVQGLIGT